MDWKNGKSNVVIYTILVLCFLNLILSAYLIVQLNRKSTNTGGAEQFPLPADLDSAQEKQVLFEKFKKPYNAKNYQKLYHLFDESVRVQVTRKKVAKTIDELHSVLGTIEKGAYTYFEANKSSTNVITFHLHYNLKVSVAEKAILRITVIQQGNDPYRIVGFNMNTQNT